MTLEKIALAALMALGLYIATTVQSLSVEVAVIQAKQEAAITPTTFARFSSEVRSDLDRYNQWLGRLSARLNKLETEDHND